MTFAALEVEGGTFSLAKQFCIPRLLRPIGVIPMGGGELSYFNNSDSSGGIHA